MADRKDRYQRIVDLIFKAMETPESWQKTWQSMSTRPRNHVSGHKYTGMNAITCMVDMAINEYKDGHYVTFNQAEQLGLSVKGQKATPIIFMGKAKDKKSDDPEKTYKFAKIYNCWNINKLGLYLPEPEIKPNKLEAPHVIADALCVAVENNASYDPCYIPSIDTIKMPMEGQFEREHHYQSTFYHECVHATGAKKRLDRKIENPFGSELYAIEELVAEIGSVLLCADLGIKYEIQNHASYLNSWKKAIKEDSNILVKSARKAQNAVDYIHSQMDLMKQQNAA